MRFAAAAVAAVLLVAAASPAFAFAPAAVPSSRHAAANANAQNAAQLLVLRMSSSVEQQQQQQQEDATAVTARKVTKKDDRLRFMKSGQFYRQGFKEVRESVEGVMSEQFKSSTVDELKASNYVMERDGVKVYLAKVRSLLFLFFHGGAAAALA